MACSATLLMLPVEAVSRLHTRESLGACAAHSVQCSNFIAAHPEIRRILNHGTPLQSEMWHPIARPHYRLPADLPPLVTTLKGIEDSVEVAQDAWTLGEVRKLREGCEWAIRHGLALVVFFGHTLSGSTLPGKGFAR